MIRAGTLLLLLAIALPAYAQPQRAETFGAESPAITAGGNVAVSYGLSAAQVQALTKAVVTGAVGPLKDEIVDLSSKLGLTQSAVVTMLHIIGQDDVPLEKLPQKLTEVAEHYKSLEARSAALEPQDPVTRDLVQRAQAAIKFGHLDEADRLVNQAEQVELAAAHTAQQFAQQARATADQRMIRAATDRRVRGDIASTQLRYLDAAQHYQEAADLIPAGHPDEKGRFLFAEAQALEAQGDERGDTAALLKAISTYQLIFQEVARGTLLWAGLQFNLGRMLAELGERENGTARLEQAVAAYQLALQVWTRDRVPLLFGAGLSNLGNVLRIIGERENGTARLEQAVAAHQLALQVWTRDRVPLGWPGVQTNLCAALQELGERMSGTVQAEQAVTLQGLGERLSGTSLLEQGVAACRAALEEEHVSIIWAIAQVTLGAALEALGEREDDTQLLQQAIDTDSLALKEFTFERMPIKWAEIQYNIGLSLAALGRRTYSSNQLKEALACFQRAEMVFRAAGITRLSDGCDQMIDRLQQELVTHPPSNGNPPKPHG